MNNVKIEILFPEFCNLFGDMYNMKYLKMCLPDAEFIETEEFKAIRKKFDEYSVDGMKTACELAFAKLVKAKGNFSYSENKDKKVNKIGINASFEKTDNNEPYGDYFKSLERY